MRSVEAIAPVVAAPQMRAFYAQLDRIAAADFTVLIIGETGCGKEVVASELHRRSRRADRPQASVNCAAIHESLVESELFGHERGAFTGAVATHKGHLENASGSTLFLDEVGELSPSVQAKLLRVLETKKVTRLGDTRERAVDVRIVAATNRNLEREVERGAFRSDLYFRLCTATLRVPPLRERVEEVEPLAEAFLRDFCARGRRAQKQLSEAALARLREHRWPGNVRELKNVIEYVAATSEAEVLTPADFDGVLTKGTLSRTAEPTTSPDSAATSRPTGRTFRPLADELRDLERQRISEALEETNGNQTAAALLLGMPLRTFFAKVRSLRLSDRTKPRTYHRRASKVGAEARENESKEA